MNNKRIDSLDLLKTFAILIVIGTHVPIFEYDFINNSDVGTLIQYCLKIILEGVPLFLTINGFLLFRKKELDIKKHYKKTLKIFILVFVWAVILIIVGFLFDKTRIDKSIFIDYFVQTGKGLYTAELWYLIALASIYLIYPFLWEAYSNKIKIFNLFFIILFVITIVPSALYRFALFINIDYRANWLISISNVIARFNLFDNHKWQLLYFCFGGIINEYYEVLREKRTIFIISGIIGILLSCLYGYIISKAVNYTYYESFVSQSIFMLIIIAFIFSITCDYKNNNLISRFVSLTGQNTLGIYITHSFFIRIARLFVPSITLLFRLIILIASFIFSLLFTLLIKKIKYLNKLVEI